MTRVLGKTTCIEQPSTQRISKNRPASAASHCACPSRPSQEKFQLLSTQVDVGQILGTLVGH